MAPLFAFFNHFPALIPVGSQQMPVKVARMIRADFEAFERLWDELIAPRGTETPEQAAALEPRRLAFFEDTIRAAISLDPGVVQLNGEDVTTGAGLLELFHMRKDVLSSLMFAIYTKNRLTDLVKKTSSLPPDSVTGSAASIPAPDGAEPEPTAAAVGSSITAPAAAATDA